jgi:ABC-type transport system involved in cytochrome bd biosynthesis fused ATPase/permease subunit
MDAMPFAPRRRRASSRALVTIGPSLPLPPGPYVLRVSGLSTRWPDGEVVELHGADLLLPPGRRVALTACGRLGGSALAAVLLRLLDYDGTVTLNDVEVRDLSAGDVRRVIGLCACDARVHAGTVADNVRIACPGAADADVADAIHRAGVGLEPAAPLVDGDGFVPGGRRQRVALARALLADVPIVIIDDPDPDLDVAAAQAVLSEMIDAAGDRTLLLLMRRAALPGATPVLRHVDEVLALNGS